MCKTADPKRVFKEKGHVKEMVQTERRCPQNNGDQTRLRFERNDHSNARKFTRNGIAHETKVQSKGNCKQNGSLVETNVQTKRTFTRNKRSKETNVHIKRTFKRKERPKETIVKAKRTVKQNDRSNETNVQARRTFKRNERSKETTLERNECTQTRRYKRNTMVKRIRIKWYKSSKNTKRNEMNRNELKRNETNRNGDERNETNVPMKRTCTKERAQTRKCYRNTSANETSIQIKYLGQMTQEFQKRNETK